MMDEHIYNYFNGNLSAAEIRQFDQKIREDPAFAEEVAFYCSTRQEIKNQLAEEKRKRFREIYRTEGISSKPPVILMQPWFRVAAAAMVILAMVSAWLFWPQPSAKSMADQFIQDNLYVLPNTMGAADSLQTGIKFSNSNRLSEALTIFEELVRSDSKNESVIKNAGIVSLRMKEYDKAITYFTSLEKMEHLNSNPGKFYKALTLLQRSLPGDTETAKQLLRQVIENNLQGKEAAIKIVKKL